MTTPPPPTVQVSMHLAVTVPSIDRDTFAALTADVFDDALAFGDWHPGRRFSVDSDSYADRLQPMCDWLRERRVPYLTESTTRYTYPTPTED